MANEREKMVIIERGLAKHMASLLFVTKILFHAQKVRFLNKKIVNRTGLWYDNLV